MSPDRRNSCREIDAERLDDTGIPAGRSCSLSSIEGLESGGCINMLAWLVLAPLLLLILGIPLFISAGSVIAIFKKPHSVSSTDIESPRPTPVGKK